MSRTNTTAEIVAAIRADKIVGQGTCSVIDECWDDQYIERWLQEHNIRTAKRAIKDARAAHRIFESVTRGTEAWLRPWVNNDDRFA